MRARRALFVLEPFPRSLWRFAATLPALSLAMLTTPLSTGERRLSKTLALPVSALCGLWDGTVSALRQHEQSELSDMADAAGSEDYEWEYREVPFPLGGRAVVFFGVPR